MTKYSYNKISADIRKCPEKDWNDLVRSSEFGTYFQTIEYAKAREHISGHVPFFIRFYEDKKVIGQIVLFQTRLGLGHIQKIFGRGKIFSVYRNLAIPMKYISWTHGPLIFDSSNKRELMITLGKYLQSQKIKFSGHSHPLDKLQFPSNLGFQIENKATFIIDLRKNLETIFSNTNKNSVRKNIKRAEERGVSIKQIVSKKDILANFNLLKEHHIRNKLPYTSKLDVLKNYTIGKNKGLTGFLAEYHNESVASLTVVYLNGYLVEQGIARSKVDIQKKLYAQELLRWHIIKWGNENDHKFYDLAGVKLHNRNSKEEGIFRNKEKWGGELIRYPSYSNINM